MEQGSPTGGVVNMTRAMEALAPLLNHPRRRIIQVEALVTVATSLLFLQLVLGFCKRRWHNSIVKAVLSLSNAVMFPLILYTLGLMQSSPIKNSVYPVLAVSLLLAALGTNTVKQYDFHDNKKVPEYVFEMARYAFYLFMLLTLVSPTTFKQYWGLEHQDRSHSRASASSNCVLFLFVVSYTAKVSELELGFLSRDRRSGKIIENWMKKKVDEANDHQNDRDPEFLKGYNYLIKYNWKFSKRSIITIDMICDFCSNSDNGKALKDVCLSFALFELLKRRYYGFVCAEARLPETKHFFFKCLLPTENDYERAFRIVEIELGFCYDFFFTKYYSIYVEGLFLPLMLFLFLLLLTRISLICAVVVYTLQSSLVLETLDPIVEVHNTRADYIIALVVLGTVLMVELLQATFYLASDWFKVSLACRYVILACRCKPIELLFEKVNGLLRRITISVGWRNRIGQYSVISDFTDYYKEKRRSFWKRIVLLLKGFLLLKEKPAEEVSDPMKKYIARSLISTHGNLGNWETSREQNLKEIFGQYYRTLEYQSQLELLFIWHIATDYCDLPLSGNGINQDDRDVAVKFSRYFAYLIVSVPELLPYHAVDIRELSSKMMDEILLDDNLASTVLSKSHDAMEKLAGTGQEDNPKKIFLKGVKLGKQLELMQDENQRWNLLAGFWVETIIYIAPSHMTAKQHMENLENGGEFLTHIWAMLSHCGILNLARDKDQGTRPAPSTPETV